jgi:aminoglycoside/choline kinase family phosphotransferase
MEESKITDYHTAERIYTFLDKRCSIELFDINALAVDASRRKYYRIAHNAESFILMDAEHEPDQFAKFIEVDSLLHQFGFSAPKIFFQDNNEKLMLLEDFGELSYTKALLRSPEKEWALYEPAVKLLKELHRCPTDNLNLAPYDPVLLNQELSVFLDWYLSHRLEDTQAVAAGTALFAIFNDLYSTLEELPPTIVLRDYHADNLMVIKGRSDTKNVGVLDFQDAVLGSPLYDLVSLLEDARRDVHPETVAKSKELFLNLEPALSKEIFDRTYAILAMQRNLKIIGIFHRLCKRDKKQKYINYLPRVWGYVMDGLKSPTMKSLRTWFNKYDVV